MPAIGAASIAVYQEDQRRNVLLICRPRARHSDGRWYDLKEIIRTGMLAPLRLVRMCTRETGSASSGGLTRTIQEYWGRALTEVRHHDREAAVCRILCCCWPIRANGLSLRHYPVLDYLANRYDIDVQVIGNYSQGGPDT